MKNSRFFMVITMIVFSTSKLLSLSLENSEFIHQNQIINIANLDDEIVEKFFKAQVNDVIVECSEGAKIPLFFAFKGECLSLDSVESSSLFVNVLKSCYIRCDKHGTFLFSYDLNEWKNFSELFTGEISSSLEIEKGSPAISIQLELNTRSK